MLYDNGACELIAAAFEGRGRSAEARAVRNGEEVLVPASIAIEAVIVGYDKAADEAAEDAAGEDI